MTKHFVTLFIIFRLFYLEFKNKYPNDYFDELADAVTKYSKLKPLEDSLLHISCTFLYSSNKRFEFCQHFIKYCQNFVDKK